MKSIVRFSAPEWNRLKSLLTMEYPYLCIQGSNAIATNKKVIIIKKLKHEVSKNPVFIHMNDMARLVGTGYVRVKISKEGVWIRYSEGRPKKLEYATKKMEFPDVNKLDKLERREKDTKVTFSVSVDNLKALINCAETNVITLRVHSKSFVGCWKSGTEKGYFSQFKVEKEK